MQNDLISRSAMLKAMRTVTDDTTCPMNIAAEIEQYIGEAPAVDAVVLPVKPGDVVWILNHKFAAEIEEIRITKDGVFAVWVEHDKGPELTELWDDGEFDIKEIGKTVFLTVEEWEKAMYPCEYCFSCTYRSCDGCGCGERRADDGK